MLKVIIAPHVVDYVSGREAIDRQRISTAITLIADDPEIGYELVFFPWRPGVLEYDSEGYAINYRVSDGVLNVVNVQKIPDISDLTLTE